MAEQQQIFGSMTDMQLRQAIHQLSSAARSTESQYAAPVPQAAVATQKYMKNLQAWSTASTPPPPKATAGGSSSATRSSRRTRNNNTNPVQGHQHHHQQQQTPYTPAPLPMALFTHHLNPPRAILPTTPQALHWTYPSRMRTGCTLLMQPILNQTSTSANTNTITSRASTRRIAAAAAVNYADPGSGDDLPDAGAALDSDDSDFVAGGSTRAAVRQSRLRTGGTTMARVGGTATPLRGGAELDQSYLGMAPPDRFIKQTHARPIEHPYPSTETLQAHAQTLATLVPIRVEFETETHRIRDCFVWNLRERMIKPEMFARTFCADLELPMSWVDTVANQIRAQLEEHEGIAAMDLGLDGAAAAAGDARQMQMDDECRVIVSIDVQIAAYHLLDHIEWDLLSPLTPEAFASTLCLELGLAGEARPLIAHAVHEELMRHKKDAVEWGVVGGDRDGGPAPAVAAADERDRSGFGLLKDKTGLGLGWSRTPKDGRGPKRLRSVWRDWAEAEEFRTRFEVLTADEVERREVERERASRRLRRETSKFQSSARTRRR